MANTDPWGLAHVKKLSGCLNETLMKPYFDMGLRQLAHTSGYPVGAIQSCSQFKRTHHFLMEAWQAFYQVMMQRFLEYDTKSGNIPIH